MRLLRQSAAQGDDWAMLELADRLLNGRGCEADPEEGMRWLRYLAGENFWKSDKAREILADRILAEHGYPAHPADTLKLLRLYTKKGEVKALITLADRLIDNSGRQQRFDDDE